MWPQIPTLKGALRTSILMATASSTKAGTTYLAAYQLEQCDVAQAQHINTNSSSSSVAEG